MSNAIVFILFAIAGGNSPDLTSLAVYPTSEACSAAADAVRTALSTGEGGKLIVCIGSDALADLARKNGVIPGN